MTYFESKSEAQTTKIARDFAKELRQGDVVALLGDLGAGKTAFVKGISEEMGILGEVSSPTFTIVNQYDGKVTLYHFDAYRLENAPEDDLDWLDDYLFSDGICLIEWAENIKTVLPKGYIEVRIEKDPFMGEDYRKITIKR